MKNSVGVWGLLPLATVMATPNNENTTAEAEIKKTFGYVIQAISGATQVDYVTAIAAVVGPKKVKSIGVMNSNVTVWLADDASAGKLESTDVITVKGKSTQVWPFVRPLRNVKLFGVPPIVSNDKLKEELSQHGRVCSQIKTELVHGMPEEFGPIESLTRTLRMSFETGKLLPSKLALEEDGEKITIRTQVGKRKCFRCDKAGHVGRTCPQRNLQKATYADVAGKKGEKENMELGDEDVFHSPAQNKGEGGEDDLEDLDDESQTKNENPEELDYQSDASFVLELTPKETGETKGWLPSFSRQKRKTLSPKYSLRNKIHKGPYHWHFEEWKHITFMNGNAPIKKQKLLEFLQSVNLTPDKQVFELESLALNYTEDLAALQQLLEELHAAFHSKHKYAKSVLSIICNALKANADKSSQ